jgi:hypothetical protein
LFGFDVLEPVREPVGVSQVAGVPAAPLPVLFDFDERFTNEILVFEIVFDQEQFEGSSGSHYA